MRPRTNKHTILSIVLNLLATFVEMVVFVLGVNIAHTGINKKGDRI